MTSPRNPAIDLARWVAVFGVIVIHCAPTTCAAGYVVGFFLNFCVPFFLLAALYFFWREAGEGEAGGPSVALRRRLPRLLLPYAAWTLIYVVARGAKLVWQGRSLSAEFGPESITRIVGAGGGAVQLYFLPLLMLAFCLTWLLAPWVRRTPTWGLAGLLLPTSFVLTKAEGMVPAMPATAVGRLGALYADWVLWMLATVIWAAVVTRWAVKQRPRVAAGLALLSAAGAINLLVVARLVPYAWRLHTLLIATLAFGGCIHLAEIARRLPRWAVFAPSIPFGIFLSHHLFLEMIELVDARLDGRLTEPYSGGTIILVAVVVLVVSAGFTTLIARWPGMARVLLGRQAQ